MANSLRIMSYNYYGLKSSFVDLYDLCDRFDVIFMQETLLFNHELSILSTVHPDFEGMGISAIDDTCNILAGRPYGGVAILIRKHLTPFCEFVLCDDPRMMALEVKHFNDKLYFLMCTCLVNVLIIMIYMLSI